MGCRISCVDPRADRLGELRSQTPIERGYSDLGMALSDGKHFHGAAICSPPSFHVEQTAAALRSEIPVLLEKPVAPTLSEAERLGVICEKSPALLLGYTWRWWPPINDLRTRLLDGSIGPLRHVRFVMSANLADWHPWERYQDFFMAHRDLGGGALLDESHWIDLMLWFFGMPEWISADLSRLSELEIDVDDNVDIVAAYAGGFRVTLHLDLYGRPHEKSVTAVGQRGTLVWQENPNRLSWGYGAANDWEYLDYSCQRNDMFLAVAHEFLNMIEGNHDPSCGIDDGLKVLQIVEAVRRSSDEGCRVSVSRMKVQ